MKRRLMRTGTALAAGAATAGAAAAGLIAGIARRKAMTSGVARPAPNRWLSVTIACPPERLSEPGGLPEPITRLERDAEVRIQAAPGGRGTELGLRLREDVYERQPIGITARLSGADPRQRLRSALREAKSLIETGEVIQPDSPPTTRSTLTGKALELATKRAGGEGRL
ncbi:MAG TPA: hypothetical protein VFU43_29535 [Streptosporangiaceae bacterium]|nr:hypothetical protein [Streptosporangiaceae bacterium]